MHTPKKNTTTQVDTKNNQTHHKMKNTHPMCLALSFIKSVCVCVCLQVCVCVCACMRVCM